MKKIRNICFITCTFALVSACKLDNYDPPTASLQGSFIDELTHELVEQDIVGGTKIIFVEQGFANPEEQSMVVKTDGTYRNQLIFAGKYDFYFNESNFVLPDTLKGKVLNDGDNKLDFVVQPYIRIKNSKIERIDNKIVATFSIQSTVAKKVKQIGLFAHVDYVVGDRFKLIEVKQEINSAVEGEKQYQLEIDLAAGNGTKLIAGKEYYFRVGALIDENGAKYNYASAIRLKM